MTTDTTNDTPAPQRPYGRSLSDFGELKPAETLLLAQCRIGEHAIVSKARPDVATEDNTVRAEFLRFLLLGGDAQVPVHERGVRLSGVWITGVLDLSHTVTVSPIVCTHCNFDKLLWLRGSRVYGGVFLDHSAIPGLEGDGMEIEGVLLLRRTFQASGRIRLIGAKINGNLECDGAKLNGHREAALILDGATIQGSVFLRDGFLAMGPIRLPGALISGDLDCTNAQFDCNVEASIFASNLRVAGRFLLYKLKHPAHSVCLTAASVGVLIDDEDAWGENLMLDGFAYGSLGSGAQTSSRARLAWLDKQQSVQCGFEGDGADFRPQPWRQLQKVLREMGHTEDARQVAIAFEDRLRRADLIGLSPAHWWGWRKRLYRFFARSLHYGFRVLTGYGYRPIRLLGWFFGVWLSCAAFYWFSALPPQNVFAPSNPLVFQEAAYEACVPGSDASKAEQAKPADAVPAPVKGAGNWYLCASLREEYTGFSPLAYSLDVILPLVDLQQEKDWAPMIPTPKAVWWEELRSTGWKHGARLVLWAETLFGWLASLLLVAIVSGLTKRRED